MTSERRGDGREWRSGGAGGGGGSAAPLVGITTDVEDVAAAGGTGGTLKAVVSLNYARAVMEAGGVPVLLPPIPELAAAHAAAMDAFVFSGGDDARTEQFGQPRHAKAKPVHARRQEYEVALLNALRDARPRTPVLGVCLGMQMMALHAGGRLNQCLPETLASHAQHWGDTHRVRPIDGGSDLARGVALAGPVHSKHRQAVEDPGRLTVLAVSEDGVIEAASDSARPFYVGVQWHPERTESVEMGVAVFRALVRAAERGER